ncbi:hypothetical protein G7066_02380 [Leucobacter coleopterorum]|uniref:Uncharacterized protein n=1 Tax=Leucobacter coleopterorum TaxID=2714933 RepID=A0ABX6JYH8_9MICO|nr:hypothetical protein [Leucobacter coleopterorum]QIM17825.1 hypothetical protein G7066_02380 [Leucobacter coleopterorum]
MLKVREKDSRLRKSRRSLALGVAVGLLAGMFAVSPANAVPDGLTASVGSEIVVRNSDSDAGFPLQVTDSNDSGASFDNYLLGGVPADWEVKNGATLVAPTSPDPVLYSLPKDDVLSGQISLLPPVGYVGTVSGLSLSRETRSPNLVTDFDGGTFDYIGTAKPILPLSNTNYQWDDPTVGEPGIVTQLDSMVPAMVSTRSGHPRQLMAREKATTTTFGRICAA